MGGAGGGGGDLAQMFCVFKHGVIRRCCGLGIHILGKAPRRREWQGGLYRYNVWDNLEYARDSSVVDDAFLLFEYT